MSCPETRGIQVESAPARSLLILLPYFWSRILFPGVGSRVEPVRWRAVLLLLVLPGVLLYPCLSFHLFEPDEGRYAEIAREMLVRGEWIVPYLQGEPYLDKPPLLYWSIICSYGLFGVDDWSARLVPALAVHGCILLTYVLGRRLVGERSAFWGALLLSLAPGFVSVARLLVLDGLLTLCVWLALLAALEAVRGERLHWGWWLLAAVATGLGVLTKGPVALLLLLPPVWLHQVLKESTWRLRWTHLSVLGAVVLGVCLPWYVAVSLREPGFPRYFFWEHNVVRFLDPFDHLQPVWFYVPILLGGLLPGTLLAVSFARFLLSGERATAQRRTPELGFLLLAGGWCPLFFSLSGCKLPTYVLPAFPALALALGTYVARSRWQHSRQLPLAVGVSVVVLGLAHTLIIPWYAAHRSPMRRPDVVADYCADPQTPVICYPRNCDSVAFYLGRADLQSYRSKETPALIRFLQEQPRAVILFTHRHSLKSLQAVLPPNLCLTGATPLFGSAKLGPEGECHMAVVERRP